MRETRKRLLGVSELAGMLGMSRAGIADAADAGRLGPVDKTPGGHRRFDPVTVVEALRARGATVPAVLEAAAGVVEPPQEDYPMGYMQGRGAA